MRVTESHFKRKKRKMAAAFYESNVELLYLLFPTLVNATDEEAAFKVICELTVLVGTDDFDGFLLDRIRPFCQRLDADDGSEKENEEEEAGMSPEFVKLTRLLRQKVIQNRRGRIHDNHFSHTWLSLRIYAAWRDCIGDNYASEVHSNELLMQIKHENLKQCVIRSGTIMAIGLCRYWFTNLRPFSETAEKLYKPEHNFRDNLYPYGWQNKKDTFAACFPCFTAAYQALTPDTKKGLFTPGEDDEDEPR